VTTNADEVLAALKAGETGLPLEIPADNPEQTRHLMLVGLAGDAIQYAESGRPQGPSEGPPVWETMTGDELRRLLAAPGAAVLLFEKG
jgi:hypothetical protein